MKKPRIKTEEQWRAIMADVYENTLSIPEICIRHDVSPTSIHRYRRIHDPHFRRSVRERRGLTEEVRREAEIMATRGECVTVISRTLGVSVYVIRTYLQATGLYVKDRSIRSLPLNIDDLLREHIGNDGMTMKQLAARLDVKLTSLYRRAKALGLTSRYGPRRGVRQRRAKVLEWFQAGLTRAEIARKLRVNRHVIEKDVRVLKATGQLDRGQSHDRAQHQDQPRQLPASAG